MYLSLAHRGKCNILPWIYSATEEGLSAELFLLENYMDWHLNGVALAMYTLSTHAYCTMLLVPDA